MIIFVFYIISCVFSSNFNFRDSISVLGSFDENVYYLDSGRVSDFFLSVDPSLYTSYSVNELELALKGDFSYNQYFSESNLTYFESDSSAIVKLKPDKRTYIELIQEYQDSSDPPITDGSNIGTYPLENGQRYKWVNNNFLIKTNYVSDSTFWAIDASFKNTKINYLNPLYNNLDNNSYFFTLTNYFAFLPETSIILGLKTGFYDYLFPDTSFFSNSDSTHYELYTGVKGRLTNTVTLYLKFGYMWLDYDTGKNFHEPTINVEFRDLFSQVSSATAGYERTAYDSTYSNLYVDNKLYMVFKSIFYDRLINLFRLEYIHRYFWQPNSRVDNMLGGVCEFSYPLTSLYGRNISAILKFSYEWVTSDALNANVTDSSDIIYFGSDPSVDYKRLFISFGLTTKY